jgi:hypothetical protein
MRLVPEPALRREYRRRLWNVLKRRPHISVLRGYCVKCALHFHYNRLIGRMRANHAALGSPTYELPPTMRSDAPASLSRDTEPAAEAGPPTVWRFERRGDEKARARLSGASGHLVPPH